MPLFLNKILGLTNPAKIKSLANATNFSRNELTKAWPLLIKTDLKLKSGVPDAKTSIQVFTCEFLANAENLSRRTP
jgi:DNA polymerase III delta subunit